MRICMITLVLSLICATAASSQVLLHGRIYGERVPGSEEVMPFSTILCFAGLPGMESEPMQFRTWEMEPVAWYRMSGSPGNYTVSFSNPAHFMRPIVLTNIFTRDGDDIHRIVSPEFDYAYFFEGEWDSTAASEYYQLFQANGTSVTHIGIKPVHDGVDGAGPGSQNLLASIHRKGPGTPDTWEQVGPTATILEVDCGGPKNYSFSTGWNSGEVPLIPGETYAVRLRAEDPDGVFQMFWGPAIDDNTDCYRIGSEGGAWQGRSLWMAVSTDGDGLVIPYNKRAHKEFREFAGTSDKWSQTYVAQGRGLASVMISAAVSGAQPPLSRQRLKVRVREGGPDGPVVGVEKIAIGNGIYTGDASWGWFGAVFAPGEVPLEPGKTYAIEFENMEHLRTLHGFTNIKGDVSNDIAAFNPYMKIPPDTYEHGRAYFGGTEPRDFDLDMQILEYEANPTDWAFAVDRPNLIRNGRMTLGDISPDNNHARFWERFSIGEATILTYLEDRTGNNNRLIRVSGHPDGDRIVDGGYVQRVSGLSDTDTYRLSGRVRSTWPLDIERLAYIGYDPTGQDDDPEADTIIWAKFPGVHGVYETFQSEPIRLAKGANSISIWLRARTTTQTPFAFEVDFDNFALYRARTDVPRTSL